MSHLQITRLRVEQLRRFRQPLELRDFEPGLNILTAPNEAGKSTLVRAIRAAFFERHRSTVVDDLRPWGEGSGAAPQVELDFLLDGQPHELVKSFLGKKRCTLRIGVRTLDGVDAEDHLAQRFGFAFATKGASKPEHWGIPGLLWIEQGSGQVLDVDPARDHLHDALQGQVGAVAGSLAATGGDELLEQFRAQRNELLTQATGKPRGAYEEAVKLSAALEAEVAALDIQIAGYREQVDQLAALRQQHLADEAAQPWEALREALADARRRQQALEASQAQLEADRVRLLQIDGTRGLLAKELEGFARQQSDAAARELALAQAAEQLRLADAALATARGHAQAARVRADAARVAARLARQQGQHASLLQQLRQAQAEASRSGEALQRADAAQQRMVAVRAGAAAMPAIGRAQVQRLLDLERTARDAALRREAVATRLQYELPEGQALALQIGGQELALRARGERLLDAPTTLALPGGGTLVITPGGEDLAQLARSHDEARHDLQAALAALGVADPAEAQARLAAAADRAAQVKLAEQAFAIVAPKGLEPLRMAQAEAQARIDAAQQALAGLPAAAPADAVLAPEQAEAEQDTAAAGEATSTAALAEAQRRQAAAQSLRDTAQREHLAAQAALSDPARAQRQAEVRQQLLAGTAEHDALAARVAAAGDAVRAARPDIVAQDIDRLQRSIEQLTRNHQQRREHLLLLENTLQQAGAQGLEEQRDALAGRLGQAQRRHAELQRRAEALDLLCRMLDARRQATLARLQAPLQARLAHYLPLLLPGASLQMDEGLAPGTLSRPQAGGATESGPTRELSFGAREQLGLITRFAYADLLQQAGRPTLLILDDALVHSDAPRLAQMKRVLFDAAQRHQVLLFTCHPQNWQDMGVALRTLN
ncbi:AAA family ATPase [Variovorax sp. J22P168]|uniref:AAA family ATPase n=1 Tax=Variovorax jilinensis TaxID=3053513 RepID=UPI002576E2C2|nr:AAA family ATPase [Variovorax sp. J22P168]MDM0012467.1 AAA family ATPase [Variovorax sp. J22P168]